MLGSPYEVIINMTDDLTLTDPDTNLVVGLSGLGGGKTLTLPKISTLRVSEIVVVNKSSSGGTITVAKNSADSTIVGRVTVLVATGLTMRHDGISQWYGI